MMVVSRVGAVACVAFVVHPSKIFRLCLYKPSHKEPSYSPHCHEHQTSIPLKVINSGGAGADAASRSLGSYDEQKTSSKSYVGREHF